MKLNLPLIASALSLCYGLNAQSFKSIASPAAAAEINKFEKKACGAGQPTAQWDAWFNQKVEEFKSARASGKANIVNYTIPVIIHIIHGGQSVGSYPNIKAGQANSQITVLNQDYAGTGLNVSNVPSVFSSDVSNTGVTFCLAKKDTNGALLAEPGIERINYNSKGWANPASSAYNTPTSFQNYINGTIKPGSIWDPTKYLNIWLTDENQNAGLLGFATFPAGSGLTGLGGSFGDSQTDGVWCYSASFGSSSVFAGGTYAAPYDKGRTATHEIGHWLGLRHIWGDDGTACSGSDFCNDTPNQADENYGCPNFASNISCSNGGDMAMNFMDYTDDLCMYMFTNDQTSRIQTAMANGTFRSQLTASSATLCGTAPNAAFQLAPNDCIHSDIPLTDQTTGSSGFTYVWSSNPSAGVTFNTSTSPNPTVNFTTTGTYTISVTVTNGFGSDTESNVITINECVGIKANNLLNKNIRLVPNPSGGMVNLITSLNNSQNLEITIHNSLGQLISTTKHNAVTNNVLGFDLTNYPAGVYFVTINNGSEKTIKRLILNK